MLKALEKLGIEMFFMIIKTIYDKPVGNIILKWAKTEVFSFEVRNKKAVTLSTLIQYCI
jgi:hypothetical protein